MFQHARSPFLRGLATALLASTLTSGCAWMTVPRVPDGARQGPVVCKTSTTAAGFDVLGAAALGGPLLLGGTFMGLMFAMDHPYLGGGVAGLAALGGLALGATVTALYARSAAYGFEQSRRCRNVKAGRAAGDDGDAEGRPTPPKPKGPAPRAGGFTLRPDVELPMANYRAFALDGDADACRDACEREVDCVAFTWVPPGARSRTAQCHLKNSVPKGEPMKGFVSGVR